MTTGGISKFEAKTGGALHGLDAGAKGPLISLRGILSDRLPDLAWEDFVEAKKIWEPRVPD
jgi:hypothetical protein